MSKPALKDEEDSGPKRNPVYRAKRELTGPEQAAVVLLALGEEYGQYIWRELHDEEIRDLSITMARLGMVESETVEELLITFVTKLSMSGGIVGNDDNTESLLLRFLDPGRVTSIMEEIRGPAGRNMWEKLSNVQESVLANYLKNEYPQTVAVILSKIRSEHAARVLSILPEELAMEVINRMLKMESVQKDILEKIEQTLRTEFMSNLSQTVRRDAHEQMAEIFNNFDRQTETRFLSALDEDDRESADRIKTLMFTFEDLGKLAPAGIQTLLRNIDKDKLAIALKGANDRMKDFFFSNMSSRASKLLKEDMDVLGPVRLKDVDEAQSLMVNTAKDLAAKGEIVIAKSNGEEELVY
jgi:flagellar motor switch protein FliG